MLTKEGKEGSWGREKRGGGVVKEGGKGSWACERKEEGG